MSAVATSLMTLLVGVELTHSVERQTLCSAVHVFLLPLEAAGSVIGVSTPLDSPSPLNAMGTAGSAKNKQKITNFISPEWRSLVISSNVDVCVTNAIEQS